MLRRQLLKSVIAAAALGLAGCANLTSEPAAQEHWLPTGDLGIIIERADGRVALVNTSSREKLAEIDGLGDLSHASAVYSRDERYAYVFGRDGGLSKVDLIGRSVVGRVMQSGNSIGGAISQDGSLVAVSNYEPGGVRIFNSDTLEMVLDLPAVGSDGQASKTVGLVDAPGHKFVFSLFDSGEIWVVDFSQAKANGGQPQITKFDNAGKQPYDALITPDGRYYIAGLFGEDGLALLDLWHLEEGVKHILPNYGRGEKRLPVYKMPHLEGWAIAGNKAFMPAVGRHEVLVVDMHTWTEIERIPVHSQPVFVMSSPDSRQIWVNFAFPENRHLQVFNTDTHQMLTHMEPGEGVLHMEFTPRGEEVWVSVRNENEVQVFDTASFEQRASVPVASPSGIFFTNRAHKIGL
ncbi:protein nirF [Motiliproteus coralliicola]|uniref:Protein nirF n=1 Tax=Motiliproteus coralliicola TaxID=2283196 RepID=A0A369WCK9_9GAMM|nr:cytochrome D1 domain-containing protein [Motiliproteus coralliicola]RDE19768.1 protein nirF [Motiliproteus coralliicola]